jgi:hypothetical protein
VLHSDLIGSVVECPTALDGQYQPTGWGYGIIRGLFARRTTTSTFVEVIVQTIDHTVGKWPGRVSSSQVHDMGGALRNWDLKHCKVLSAAKVTAVFAPKA